MLWPQGAGCRIGLQVKTGYWDPLNFDGGFRVFLSTKSHSFGGGGGGGEEEMVAFHVGGEPTQVVNFLCYRIPSEAVLSIGKQETKASHQRKQTIQ